MKIKTIDEEIQEVKNAKRKLIMGNPFDAIGIIISRHPDWDDDYIDEEWFIEELDKEIKMLKLKKERQEEYFNEAIDILKNGRKYTPTKSRSRGYTIDFI